MANTVMTTAMRDKSVSDDLYQKLSQFYARFLEVHREVLQEQGFPLRATIFGQPHDTIIAVDRASVIIIVCKGTATDSSSTDRYFDFSSKGTITPQQLMRSAAQELGWQNMMSLRFDRPLLDAPEALQRDEFRRVSEQMLAEIQQRQHLANKLGIHDALFYLENARTRFDAGGPSGFSDCKANCRNALISLMKGLTGTEKVREAVKELHRTGLLGEREVEVIDAIENLIAKLYGLASKTGPHPPPATEEDALFTLRLTEATLDYLIRIVAKAKGL